MQYFLFEHDDLISGKYFVTFYDDFDFDRILRVLKFCGKIITSHEFLYRKIPIKNCFGAKLFLFVKRFSIFLQHILGQTKH